MFIDEAHAIGSLDHITPGNVCRRSCRLGQSAGTDLFMVMEYLAGENASGLMRRLTSRGEKLPYTLAAHIVADACAGLHHAHELCDEAGNRLDLVHRDISPSNIFVTYSGETKVLDFGIATAAHRLTRTATGQLKGKFSYMSPEQCRGEGLDLRSDIFSLGVVLYELTTQRRLFKRANELMVLKAVTEQPIPRPCREIAGYPAELERICMKALSRDVDQRYASALGMRSDLLAVIATLGGSSDRITELAATMSGLFAERIDEKRQMISHVRHGTDLGILPAPEVDQSVEVPQIEEHSGTPISSISRVSQSMPVAPPKRRRALVIILGVAAVVWAAAVILWVTRDQSTPAGSMLLARPVPTPTMPTPAPTPPPSPHELVLHVESIPSGATVSIDGVVQGTTPYDYKLAQKRPLSLSLELDGYAPITQHLALDHDQNLLIPLVTAPTPAPPAATTKPPVKAPIITKHPKTDPKDPFQRFD